MQIDKMSTQLRLRTSWEAIDLGFSLARRWFLPLWLMWLAPALAISALALLSIDSVFLALLLIWWLQPLYERPLLHFLSRALFGEYPSVKRELGNYWRLVRPQLLQSILWRRFNPGRSFVEPVVLLEGLGGKARKKRLNVLGIGLSGTAIWFGILCWLFARSLDVSQMTLLYLMVPQEWNLWFMDNVLGAIFNGHWQDLHWLGWLVWLLSTSLMAPFYVAGGFALYISRRTHLEGWDIELAFRRMVNRHHRQQRKGTNGSATLAVVLLLVPLLCPLSSHGAEPSAQQLEDKALIEEITSQAEFGKIETRERWRPIERDKPKSDSFFKKFDKWFAWIKEVMPALGLFLKVVIISALVALVIWLLMRFTNWLDWMNLPVRKQRRKKPPTSLFGLELSRDSLPDNISETALALLDKGQIRDALSLLFRAALSHMIHHSELPIGDSSTEGECLRLAKAHRPAGELNYFRQLTDTWLLLAYAHQAPSPELTRELCLDWPRHYGEQQPGGEVAS